MNDDDELMYHSVVESVMSRMGNIHGRAKIILEQQPRNIQKEQEREQYLLDHPEETLIINAQPLRAIVPYLEFKCHPASSVARGRAIKGSDIDYGLVITEEAVTPDKQQAFTDELKQQGFTVYSQQELDQSKEIYTKTGNIDLRKQLGDMSPQVIRFHMKSEMEDKMRQQDFSDNTMGLVIYLEGSRIA